MEDMTVYVLFACSIHLFCCMLIFNGILFGILRVPRYLFFVGCFLPVWGELIVLVYHFRLSRQEGKSVVVSEKNLTESEVYRSIPLEEKQNIHNTVSIEEALIVNNALERRELIMDILIDNPKEYISFLQKAGNNDDTEVVHYAVTAMVEISKENDEMLMKLEQLHEEEPENADILSDYCDFLWHCLEQNLMQGQVELMNRALFHELAAKKLLLRAEKTDYIRMIENALKMKQYTAANEWIEKMAQFYPKSEELLLLRVSYYAAVGNGDAIRLLIEQTGTGPQQRHLSRAAKEVFAFWKT